MRSIDLERLDVVITDRDIVSDIRSIHARPIGSTIGMHFIILAECHCTDSSNRVNRSGKGTNSGDN